VAKATGIMCITSNGIFLDDECFCGTSGQGMSGLKCLRKTFSSFTNINTRKGHVYRSGKELMQPDSNAYFMDRGFKIWANDSYWFIMPFKLKDPGVNLSYKGEVTDPDGKSCYLLELTFNKVGVTPENKYQFYVDRKNFLVTWWSILKNSLTQNPGSGIHG
jgi:hypothetical protein